MSGERALHFTGRIGAWIRLLGSLSHFRGQHGFEVTWWRETGRDSSARYVSCLYSRVCVSCVECGWAMWRVHTGVLAFVPSVARSGGPYLPSMRLYVPSSLARGLATR